MSGNFCSHRLIPTRKGIEYNFIVKVQVKISRSIVGHKPSPLHARKFLTAASNHMSAIYIQSDRHQIRIDSGPRNLFQFTSFLFLSASFIFGASWIQGGLYFDASVMQMQVLYNKDSRWKTGLRVELDQMIVFHIQESLASIRH